MNKILAIIFTITLIYACGDASSTERSGKSEILKEIPDDLVQLDAAIPEDPSINGENKDLFDALPLIQENYQNKEMKLAEEGPKLMSNTHKSLRPAGDFTFYALARMETSNGHGIILKIDSFDPDELEVFQEETFYFLVSFDESWEVSDRERIHEKFSMSDDILTSSGWYEMENINVAWEKISINAGEINVLEEATESFEGTEEGSIAAKLFNDNLHQ